MFIHDFITIVFLFLVVIIAIAPLFFEFKEHVKSAELKLWFIFGWAVWIIFWGTLAVLTTAQLTFGIPQRLRFPVLFILPAVIGSVLILGVK